MFPHPGASEDQGCWALWGRTQRGQAPYSSLWGWGGLLVAAPHPKN